MKEIPVILKDAQTATLFVEFNKKQDFEIDVRIGKYLIDGKSILGILGFAAGKEITVNVIADDETAGQYAKSLGEILG